MTVSDVNADLLAENELSISVGADGDVSVDRVTVVEDDDSGDMQVDMSTADVPVVDESPIVVRDVPSGSLKMLDADAISEFKVVSEDGDPRDTDFEWQGPLVFEGIPTGDGRFIESGALTWRDLPLTLQIAVKNEGGHYGAVPAGRISRIERDDDGFLMGYGFFDTGEHGQEAKRMIAEGTLKGVSVDLSEMDYEYDAEDDVFTISSAKLLGATIVAFPAFEDAHIELLNTKASADAALLADGAVAPMTARTFTPMEPADGGWRPLSIARSAALVASGVPLDWNNDRPAPNVFAKPTTYETFNIDDNNVISGHIATWDSVHLSFTGEEIHPPRSKTNYAMLHTPGKVLCADGTTVGVARIFGDMDHVDTNRRVPPEDVAAAYADTGKLLAFVRVYDTEWGIAVAGVMAPETTDSQAAKLRGLDISPDWRQMQSLPSHDNLECVALLAVNMSGFNLGLAASGAPTNLKVAVDGKTSEITAMTGLPGGSVHSDESRLARVEAGLLRLEKAHLRQIR